MNIKKEKKMHNINRRSFSFRVAVLALIFVSGTIFSSEGEEEKAFTTTTTTTTYPFWNYFGLFGIGGTTKVTETGDLRSVIERYETKLTNQKNTYNTDTGIAARKINSLTKELASEKSHSERLEGQVERLERDVKVLEDKAGWFSRNRGKLCLAGGVTGGLVVGGAIIGVLWHRSNQKKERAKNRPYATILAYKRMLNSYEEMHLFFTDVLEKTKVGLLEDHNSELLPLFEPGKIRQRLRKIKKRYVNFGRAVSEARIIDEADRTAVLEVIEEQKATAHETAPRLDLMQRVDEGINDSIKGIEDYSGVIKRPLAHLKVKIDSIMAGQDSTPIDDRDLTRDPVEWKADVKDTYKAFIRTCEREFAVRTEMDPFRNSFIDDIRTTGMLRESERYRAICAPVAEKSRGRKVLEAAIGIARIFS